MLPSRTNGRLRYRLAVIAVPPYEPESLGWASGRASSQLAVFQRRRETIRINHSEKWASWRVWPVSPETSIIPVCENGRRRPKLNRSSLGDLTMKSTREPASAVPTQAVDRAMRLLKAIGAARQPMDVHQLAKECGLNRSTAWRLLASLEHHGMVERNVETQRYKVGYEIVRLAATAADYAPLIARAAPFLEALAEKGGDTVSLSISRSGGAMETIYNARPQNHIVGVNWVGRALPPHCTSNGKLMLALLDDDEQLQFLDRELERFTPKTIVDPDELRKELLTIREQGFALANEEYETGLIAVSAPVRDSLGNPIAFVSLSGPEYRLTANGLIELVPLVVETARQVSIAFRPGPTR